MTRKFFKNTILAVLFCIGLLLTSYPYLQNFFFDLQSKSTISEFQKQQPLWPSSPAAAGPDETASAGEPILYAALLQAMQDYNSDLFTSSQSGLTSASSYEAAALDLHDYGLSFDTIGYISIPAMDVELPLYLGASEEHMSLGASVLGQTSLPIGGNNTNCVISAHRGYHGIPYFREIELLEVGDSIEITTFWETLTYTVTGWQIIDPDSIDQILIQPGKDMVTLLTCHPYRVGTQRYLVYCERKATASNEPDTTNNSPDEEVYSDIFPPSQGVLTAPTATSSQHIIEAEQLAQSLGLFIVFAVAAILLFNTLKK